MEQAPREHSAVHRLLCQQGRVFSLILAVPQGKKISRRTAGTRRRMGAFTHRSSLCAASSRRVLGSSAHCTGTCPGLVLLLLGVSPAPGARTGFRDVPQIHVDMAAKELGISCSSQFHRGLHLAALAEPHIPSSLQRVGKKK